jgi:hypothetical protein
MMAKQAQTAGGLLSTLADKLKGFATDIGTSLIPALKNAIKSMSDFLDTLREGLRIGDLLINWQGRLRDGVQGVNKELLNSAGSYAEYREGLLGAALATGQMGEREADAIRSGEARDILIQQANQLFGLMTEAQYNAAQGEWGYAGALDESNRALTRSNELKTDAAKIDAVPAITNISALTPEAQAAAVKEYGKVQEKLTAIEAGGITKRADLLSKFYADEATAIKELQSSRMSILTSYSADEQKITADQNKSRIALARQYGEAAERAEEDHQRSMARLSEDHGRRLSKLADSRDALGIEDEMDSYAIERRRAEEDYQVGAGQRSADYAQQLAELNAAAEEQRLARTVEKDKQIRELEEKYAEENIKRSTAKTKELAIIDKSIADEKSKTETAWKLWRNEHEIFFKGEREAWDAYLKYTKASLIASSLPIVDEKGKRAVGSAPGRASGGAVLPFATYTVGENGPERLRMGAQGGYVESNKGGNSFSVAVNVAGSNATPEQIKSAVYQGIVDVMRAVH